jgi:hypothetical protein
LTVLIQSLIPKSSTAGEVLSCPSENTSTASDSIAPTIPVELKPFFEPCVLLPGENRQEFEIVQNMMIEEVRPETNIEWLWTIDLIELSWEILRYRCLKQRILLEHRHLAIKAILMRLDGAGIPARDLQNLELQVSRSAMEWRDDPQAASEIEARLRRNDFEDSAVNAELFCQTRGTFAMFDDLMHAAQNRRMVLLREITSRRELSKRPVKLQSRPGASRTEISSQQPEPATSWLRRR